MEVDTDVTLVPLKIDKTPQAATPITFSGAPPAGFTPDSLKELNELARVLLLNPNHVFPPPPQPTPNPRSAHVQKAKEDGNTAFRKGDYQDAIRLYSISADMAATRPVFEANVYARDELAITLCNRSAAYALAGEWVNALVDAEAVVGLKKPWVKGHFRKGKALQGMGRLEEAREALLLGLQFDPTAEDLMNAVKEVENLLRERTTQKKIEG
ncbi:translocation protein SEC72 [Pseudohyphozyma bogoriensis]|nr:translocation protein SEC72 [Pseudohyphozyma bogoriensis]